MPADPTYRYDLALINHWTTTQALRRFHIDHRIVTSHGIFPHEEIPVLGADHYVAVSEAVSDHFPWPSTVIRNPIDTDHFSPTQPKSHSLRRVAFVSNRQGGALPILTEACESLNVELRVVGKDSAVDDPKDVYNWADVVVGIARVAMEALACGRNVLCFDYMGYHGWVTPESMNDMRYSNFGGHAKGTWPSAESVASALASYDADLDLRQEIVNVNHPEMVARQYLQLGEETPPAWAKVAQIGARQLSSPKITQAIMMARRIGSTTTGRHKKHAWRHRTD